MICRAQNLNIMVDEDDRILVCTQFLHDVQESVDARGVLSDLAHQARRVRPSSDYAQHGRTASADVPLVEGVDAARSNVR